MLVGLDWIGMVIDDKKKKKEHGVCVFPLLLDYCIYFVAIMIMFFLFACFRYYYLLVQ